MNISRCTSWWPILCPKRPMAFQARNPREPHFDRKRMLEICKPMVMRDTPPSWQTCTYNSPLPEVTVHPYEQLLSKELKKTWQSSKIISFFHINPVTNRERRAIYNMFFKKDFIFGEYSADVVRLTVQNTPFTRILDLFDSNSAIAFSSDVRIGELLKLSKKDSHIHLLAAFIDNCLYSKQQLQELNKLPKIEVLHHQLSHTLDRACNVTEAVTHHTQLLSHYLTQLSKGDS